MFKITRSKWTVSIACIMALFIFPATYTYAKTTLKLAHSYPTTNHWHKGAAHAAKVINEKSNGQIVIDIYTDSQLGTEEQITEAVIFGSIDVIITSANQLSNLFTPMAIFDMPFTFKDVNHVYRFGKTDIAKQMFGDLEEEFKVKVLGVAPYGVRQLISTEKPIKSPADLKGMKFRVPEMKMWIEVIKTMGANPTPIPYVEAYLSLQQGVVDALDNPLSGMKSMKFFEVGKYISKTSHAAVLSFFLMNQDKFKALNAEDQKILAEGFEEGAKVVVDILNKEDEELGAYFEEQGLTIIEPSEIDIKAFQQATSTMPDKYKKYWIRYGADLHQKIQGM